MWKKYFQNFLFTDNYALQCVITFFHHDCGCDVEKISKKYRERFDEDFNSGNKIEISKTLHYQRRLLNDYFLELEMCRESSWYCVKSSEKTGQPAKLMSVRY